MTKFTSVFLILTFTISCAGNRTKFNYETSIASSVYEAQLKYLDNTLFNYSRISEKGSYFWKEDSSLEIKTQLFKARISYNSKISDSEKMAFFNHFEKILEKFPPNFSSYLSYFEWTVFAHNEVNKTLFKEEFPLEKAKEFYGIL